MITNHSDPGNTFQLHHGLNSKGQIPLRYPGRRLVCSWSKPNSNTLCWSQTGPRLVVNLLAHC